MITEDERIKFLEKVEITDPEYLKVELMEVIFPDGMPIIVKEQVDKIIEEIKEYKVKKNYTKYYRHMSYLIRILPSFTSELMKQVWQDLEKDLHREKIESFIYELLRIESVYRTAIRLNKKHEKELNCFKAVLNKSKQLLESMDEYEKNPNNIILLKDDNDYYDYDFNYDQLKNILTEFTEKFPRKFEKFKNEARIESWNSEMLPISRQFKGKKALKGIFIEKIYLFFRDDLTKSNVISHLENFINTIFDEKHNYNYFYKMVDEIEKSLKK